MATSDEALLRGLAAGDHDAAVGFVRRFQGRVFGLALSIVGDRATTEDVAQDAFVRAWRHAGTYDARRGSVSTWLLTITRNLAIDRARMRRAAPVDPNVLITQLRADESGGEPAVADRVPDRDHLRELLLRLPADQRRALVLATYFGRTAKEIGELDGVALGTVKTRLRTAMRKLRHDFEVHDDAA